MQLLDLQTTSLAELIVFAILAGAVIGGALFTITRRNPVTAVMALVGTFFALAGIYATLSAHFLAVLQVLVYAGAIMVLFIFVVMILNREEVEPVSWKGIITRALGVVATGYLVLMFVRVVWALRGSPVLAGPATEPSPTWGSVAETGMVLFRDFVFPFEAISLLLLVAIVGGVIVSRSAKQEDESEEVARRLEAIRKAARPESRVGELPAGAHDDHAHATHH